MTMKSGARKTSPPNPNETYFAELVGIGEPREHYGNQVIAASNDDAATAEASQWARAELARRSIKRATLILTHGYKRRGVHSEEINLDS